MKRGKSQKAKRGGGPLPLRYFDTTAYHPDATEGVDILQSTSLVRPKIGGRHMRRVTRIRTRRQRQRKTKGGFVPTVMEPFVAGVSKYIVPMALYSAYKLVTRHTGTKKVASATKALKKKSAKSG
jgi:hypothetical protein